jgi:hypothetical protein
MKVIPTVTLGACWLTEYTEWHKEGNTPFIEISDDEWREYQDHVEKCQEWTDFIVGLEAEQKAKV